MAKDRRALQYPASSQTKDLGITNAWRNVYSKWFNGAKISQSNSAPGAGFLRLEVVAGTNAGTCKLIAYAGTSTTPTTLLDNVGAGC